VAPMRGMVVACRAMAAASDGLETFITRWQGREGGQERAHGTLFPTGLCTTFGVDPPDATAANIEPNDCVCERPARTARSRMRSTSAILPG
jgi:hypothetical protein